MGATTTVPPLVMGMFPGVMTPLPPTKVACSVALEPDVIVVEVPNVMMFGGTPTWTTSGIETESGTVAALLITTV